MSYGFVLSHKYAGHLAEGSGPAYGQSTSHRAEDHGYHSGVLFLTLLIQFTNQRINNIHIICDNQSIINKAKERSNYDIPFSNQATKADWNQLESAYQLLLQSNIKAMFQYVKGH